MKQRTEKIEKSNDASSEAAEKCERDRLASINPSHANSAGYLTDALRAGARVLRERVERLTHGFDANAYEEMVASFRVLSNDLINAAHILPAKEPTPNEKAVKELGPVKREAIRRWLSTIMMLAPSDPEKRRVYFEEVRDKLVRRNQT